jgi:tyrosyl-tRNA synthetase
MTGKNSLLDELTWRGLLYQNTETLGAALQAGAVTAYCGFDPSAACTLGISCR